MAQNNGNTKRIVLTGTALVLTCISLALTTVIFYAKDTQAEVVLLRGGILTNTVCIAKLEEQYRSIKEDLQEIKELIRK